MHKLLQRQIRRHLGDAPESLRALLADVDEAYDQADLDRRLLERSLDLTAQELMEANRALHRERTGIEKLYRTLFEGSQDVIYISSPDGRLLDINPAGVRLFGFASREEILAVDLATTLYRDPGDRRRLMEQLLREDSIRNYELALRRKDGSPLAVLLTSSLIRDETGAPAAIHGIMRDVTFERELERNLRNTQKMEAVGRLAGGVAHDFNNLLAVILGSADLVRMQLDPESPLLRRIEEIRKAADRGCALTRQLMFLGQSRVLQPATLDLRRVVADMDEILRRLLGPDRELVLVSGDDAAAVHMDRSQIEQVVLNLVVNARDALAEGGRVAVEIRGGSRLPDVVRNAEGSAGRRFVEVAVSDNGCGIPETHLDRIFEPFFTTKATGKGTGLGLATVYGIVRQSGGHIHVESRVGEGTLFRIFLPAARESVVGMDEPAVASGPPRSGCETVLVAEDEPALRVVVRDVLTALGYTVHVAGDGVEALEKAGGLPRLQLLLTDMVMPRMGGAELIPRIWERYPGLPVLVVSGYADAPLPPVEALSHPGPVAFLRKPFANRELGETVRSLLDAGAHAAA